MRRRRTTPHENAFSEDSIDQELYLSKKRDIVTNPENPGVRVANGHIDIDPAKKVSNRQVREGICPGGIVVGPPNVYSKAGVDRLILVEDRAKRGERGHFFHCKSNPKVLAFEVADYFHLNSSI